MSCRKPEGRELALLYANESPMSSVDWRFRKCIFLQVAKKGFIARRDGYYRDGVPGPTACMTLVTAR